MGFQKQVEWKGDDERNIVRLVIHDYSQLEHIVYTETFDSVARLEAITILLSS